ncbi:MAG: HAMP domain-containing histidine kinase, partial [Kiritimatiellaeota bacterium]|nr:HAMP domain-containing histidine kinase [Kiritimatiellota bacterium]
GKNEIRSLSTAFNEMLDKLNLIISEHKESTDHIAHDLRSPLTHILGAIELLITKKRPPEEYEMALVSTMNSIVELQKLIDSLLDISLMETSILSDRKSVEIDSMLKKVLDVFQYALEAKNIRFEYHCEVDGVMQINEALMTRAIANLLDNAVKFTPTHGFIQMRAMTSESNFKFTLENEGAPIEEKDVSRIFDRLYRADTARTEGGFGLGLSFVKAVVEAHGGSISATNSPNGPIFTITLPNGDVG